jgi:hypothetical protein
MAELLMDAMKELKTPMASRITAEAKAPASDMAEMARYHGITLINL